MPTKEELLELYFTKMLTVSEIASIFKVSSKSIKKLFCKYDLKPRGYIARVKIPEKQELIDCYETYKSIKLVAKKYGVGEKTINKWFKEYGIKPIRSVERKYYHLRKIPFTKEQKEFIIGSLLGDGHIGNGKLKRFVVNHSYKQIEYITYKKEMLSNFVNKLRLNSKDKNRNSVTYNLTTVGHQEFNFFHDLFYDNTKKVIRNSITNYLTPYVMAIWFMDDGHTRKYSMKLCTEGFTKKENEILRDAIYVNFHISCKVCEYTNREKLYYYLSFNSENSKKLTDLIEPYMIPSMQYKLLRSSTTTCQTSKEDDIV